MKINTASVLLTLVALWDFYKVLPPPARKNVEIAVKGIASIVFCIVAAFAIQLAAE